MIPDVRTWPNEDFRHVMIARIRSVRAAIAAPRRSSRRGTAGQSLTELALVAPILLLIVLVGIDFGRVYLGYINLQQMARIAASFAGDNASAWDATPDVAVQGRYQELISNDARAINCVPPSDQFDPVFPDGFDLGDPAEVAITCAFDVVTPVISSIVGTPIPLTATAVFPVREGAVGAVPGGGGGTVTPPVAEFAASPTSGYGPLEVTFTDTSLNDPNEWLWNFGNGTASSEGPHTRTYECPVGSLPGTTCTFSAQLTVRNAGGFDTSSSQEIVVTVPPDTGPIAEFDATPTSGTAPLTVQFEFVDLLAGAVVYTNWEWDFDNDGTFDATGETASHAYVGIGSYTVTLRVTDDAGNTNSQTKNGYITTAEAVCTVPDFQEVRKNNAQALWSAAGFTTLVTATGSGNYKIRTQSLLGGTVDPQPDGCDSTITVGP